MRHTWRWFGPHDLARIEDIEQAGATGVVTALHQIPPGTAWPAAAIAARQDQIARRSDASPSRLRWTVVESLPVSEDIKRQAGDWRQHLEAWRDSLRRLAEAGIMVVCYNFMPVLDWTRTELAHAMPDGARAMRFDLADFAAFDIHILARPGAETDYPEEIVAAAARRIRGWDAEARRRLAATVTAGLPGAAAGYDLGQLRALLDSYRGIDADRLARHHADFLDAVVPVAEALGMRLCCHPDDPPWPLLGLPRVVSTEADYVRMLAAADSPANGITLCSGSLGAREDNDLPGMMARLGERVHFLHLRNVTRDGRGWPTGFVEDRHLEGATDMVALIAAILNEEDRRRDAGRPDAQIPMRPDHGQDIVTDLGRGGQPGYPVVGRLKGLAELRGIEIALARLTPETRRAMIADPGRPDCAAPPQRL